MSGDNDRERMEADMLITNKHYRQNLKNKKRIVIKVGSSSLVHPETGETDLLKLEQLVRVLCDLRNQGMDVCLWYLFHPVPLV